MNNFLSGRLPIFISAAAIIGSFLCGCAKEVSDKLPEPRDAQEISQIPAIPPMAGNKNTEQQIKVSGLDEEQKILSFDMTGYTNDGKKKWDIKGKSADIVSDTVILNDIEANAYSEERSVALKALTGRYDKKERYVRLEDNVTVVTSDGITLSAEWLKWESETDVIKTDGFVEVEKDSLYAAGYGASASTKHKEVQLDRDVIVKQGDISIRCGGPLAIDYDKNKASFYGGVRVTEPRGKLAADQLDIFFNPKSQEIESVIAERNVELMQGENVAKGQRIIYTLATGEAILTGSPEILIYSKKDFKDAFTGD